jgi:hypothetical protein
MGILQKIIQCTLSCRQTTGSVLSTLHKKHVKNTLRLVLGWHMTTLSIEGHRLGTSRRTGSSIRGHNQRGMPGVLTHLGGKCLIERDAVLITTPITGIRTSQELIRIGMSVHIPNSRVRQTGENGQVILERVERVEALRQGEIFSPAMRKPAPVRVSGIIHSGHGHTIRHIKAGKSPD